MWPPAFSHALTVPGPTIRRRSRSTPTTPRRSASTRPSRSSSPSSSIICLRLIPFPRRRKSLGYVVGTPEKLTYTKDINAYFRALAAASPRVKVWTIGKSEGGREMLLAAVSSEENLARIDDLQADHRQARRPTKDDRRETAGLVREAKPFYWLSGSIHSPETGSPEMLMELAYRLAVEDSAHVQAIRKNLIVLITPVVEVDGRDRMLDVYHYRKANPGKQAPGLVYWGKYVAHDNNRDAMGLALALSNVMMKTFLEWHPQVFHDLHESVPYLYTSTGTGPYNSWLDPIVVCEWQKLAYHEIEGMTRRGVPGVWTHGFYDGWAPNYMFYIANGHNSIGRFYETFGNGGADTRERKLPESSTSRTWYRPNPPLAQGQVVVAQQCEHAAERPVARAQVRGRQPRRVLEQFRAQVEALRRQGEDRGPGRLDHPQRRQAPRPGRAARAAAAAPGGRGSPPRS